MSVLAQLVSNALRRDIDAPPKSREITLQLRPSIGTKPPQVTGMYVMSPVKSREAIPQARNDLLELISGIGAQPIGRY